MEFIEYTIEMIVLFAVIVLLVITMAFLIMILLFKYCIRFFLKCKGELNIEIKT